MKFAIVASERDRAGMNIAGFISGLKIYYTEKEIIYAENIDEKQNIKEDFIIFVSMHEGKKEKMLSMHAPGNFKQADLGGQEGKICLTSGSVLKTLFRELNENLPEGWSSTLEVTHHGPFIEKPCCFIEIGSSEKDWGNREAGKAIAITIENAVRILQQEGECKTAIGIASPHYCPNYNKIQLNSEYALSHIIPQYVFPITEKMLKEAINKTQEKVDLAILDWKAMKSGEKQEVIKILDKLNLGYKKTSEIEK